VSERVCERVRESVREREEREGETETDREKGGAGIILTALVIHSTKISERNGENAFLGMWRTVKSEQVQ